MIQKISNGMTCQQIKRNLIDLYYKNSANLDGKTNNKIQNFIGEEIKKNECAISLENITPNNQNQFVHINGEADIYLKSSLEKHLLKDPRSPSSKKNITDSSQIIGGLPENSKLEIIKKLNQILKDGIPKFEKNDADNEYDTLNKMLGFSQDNNAITDFIKKSQLSFSILINLAYEYDNFSFIKSTTKLAKYALELGSNQSLNSILKELTNRINEVSDFRRIYNDLSSNLNVQNKYLIHSLDKLNKLTKNYYRYNHIKETIYNKKGTKDLNNIINFRSYLLEILKSGKFINALYKENESEIFINDLSKISSRYDDFLEIFNYLESYKELQLNYFHNMKSQIVHWTGSLNKFIKISQDLKKNKQIHNDYVKEVIDNLYLLPIVDDFYKRTDIEIFSLAYLELKNNNDKQMHMKNMQERIKGLTLNIDKLSDIFCEICNTYDRDKSDELIKICLNLLSKEINQQINSYEVFMKLLDTVDYYLYDESKFFTTCESIHAKDKLLAWTKTLGEFTKNYKKLPSPIDIHSTYVTAILDKLANLTTDVFEFRKTYQLLAERPNIQKAYFNQVKDRLPALAKNSYRFEHITNTLKNSQLFYEVSHSEDNSHGTISTQIKIN